MGAWSLRLCMLKPRSTASRATSAKRCGWRGTITSNGIPSALFLSDLHRVVHDPDPIHAHLFRTLQLEQSDAQQPRAACGVVRSFPVEAKRVRNRFHNPRRRSKPGACVQDQFLYDKTDLFKRIMLTGNMRTFDDRHRVFSSASEAASRSSSCLFCACANSSCWARSRRRVSFSSDEIRHFSRLISRSRTLPRNACNSTFDTPHFSFHLARLSRREFTRTRGRVSNNR